MSKFKQNTNHNNKTHNNGSLDPSFSVKDTTDIKELHWNLLSVIKELNAVISSSFNNTYLMASAKNMIDNNNVLNQEYLQKLNSSFEVNQELYHIFENKLEQINEIYDQNIIKIDDELKTETRHTIDDLLKFQQDAIARYRVVETSFIPKTKFLSENKKINKEEYIKTVTDINHERINSNQTYNNVANDLSNINEQQQYQFNHSLESSIEKNAYDITIINEDADLRIENLNIEFDLEERNKALAINSKRRSIIDNTIELNETITTITNEYKERLDNNYAPFNENEKKYQEEINSNNKIYKDLEEKVLEEFKTLLQQNDTEIDVLRQKQRDYENEYKINRKQIKKDLSASLKKDISSINKKIDAASSRFNQTHSDHDKEVLDKLTKEKKEIIKTSNLNNEKVIAKLDQEYFEQHLLFIEQMEKLRMNKSHSEAIKSSAVKNINYEKSYNFERLNAEILFNTFEKESFTTLDNYEENKDIYHKRLEFDEKNEAIRYEINEIDTDTYQDDIEHKYEINKINAERDYKIKLSNVDLDYQKKVIENRKNYHNVKTMLDIQKQQITNKYDILMINEKMDFEQKKSLFYNNCNNLQYELFKNDNESKYKLIDQQINLNQELAEVKKQHISSLANFKKRILQNKKSYAVNLENIHLYEERLAIEKNMFYNTYEHFKKTLLNIIDFENYIFSLCISLPNYYFESNKKHLLLILENTKKIKIYTLEEYHNNLNEIIKSRIDFEKEVKYKKILENMKNEWEELQTFSINKIDKLNTIINSYQNTVTTSKNALKKTTLQIESLDPASDNYEDELTLLKDQITLLKKQIKINRENISKQALLRKEQINKITKAEKEYNSGCAKIETNNSNEAKIYNDIIVSINQQLNKIKAEVIKNGNVISLSKRNYSLDKNLQKAKATNNFLLVSSKNYFDMNYSILSNSITKQYNSLRQTGENSNLHFNDEIQKLLAIEEKEYITSKNTIENNYKHIFETIEKESTTKKEKILRSLKEVNDNQNKKIVEFNTKINSINSKKEYELKCHNDNFEMYQEKYNNKNNEIINNYLAKIEKIKKEYRNKLHSLEQKLKITHKQINAQHLSNETLYQNNITNMNLEYKEYIKDVMLKIKALEKSSKEHKAKHDNEVNKYYNLYLQNQRDTKKEFDTQSRIINQKCNVRINTLKKEFKKKFSNETK